MEFGIFHEFQCAQGQTEAQAFRESFEQIEAAERWGLDAVWLAEIHFPPPVRCYRHLWPLPVPLLPARSA